MSMKTTLAARAFWLCIIAVTLLIASAGCDSIVASLTGAYTGPPPAQNPISAERVVVARADFGPEGVGRLVLDRTRFVSAGAPHDVNRVIYADTRPENQAAVAALNLRRGEVVVFSSEYLHVDEASGSMNVADWPGHDALEYPVATHRITSIGRAP